MQHNFMPGDKVLYKQSLKAEVVERGAKRNTYFVKIKLTSSGKFVTLENKQISQITKV